MAGELLSVTVRNATPMDPKTYAGPNGSGWVAECVLADITNTAGTVDGAELTLTVSDPGYIANGVLSTITRTIHGSTFVRRTFPDGNSRQISTDGTGLTILVALDDFIYSGTTITSASITADFYDGAVEGAAGSITNNSVTAYPIPCGSWVNFNGDTAESSTYRVELCTSSMTARKGQQVACVEFHAANGSSVFVNSPTLSTLQTKGFIPEVWAADISMSTETQGAMTHVNAIIYPHIGNATAVRDFEVNGAAWPTANPNTVLRVFCDKTGEYGGAIACVDNVGAGTPTVSDDPAVARANPFASIAAAEAAIKTWNNTNKGHNDFGGAKVWLKEVAGNQHFLSVSATNDHGVGRHIIETDPAASTQQELHSTGVIQMAENCLWRNVKFYTTFSSSYTVIGFSSGGSPASQMFFDDCTWENPANRAMVTWVSYKTIRNCDLTGANWMNFQDLGPDDRSLKFIGCESSSWTAIPNPDSNWANVLIGNYFPRYSAELPQFVSGDGAFIYNNRVGRVLLQNNVSVTTYTYGLTIMQNLVEKDPVTDGSVQCMNILADGDLTDVSNVVIMHNTAVGERCSQLYAERPESDTVEKFGCSKFNIFDNYNIKSDNFNMGNGDGRAGNWSYSYSVGKSGDVSLFGDVTRLATKAPANDGTDNYLGMYWQSNSEYNLFRSALGYSQADIRAMFVNYTTGPKPSPTAGGDYHLVDGNTPLQNRVPSGLSVLKYDLDGVARAKNGTGAAGAYEFPIGGGITTGWLRLDIGLSIGI